MPKLTKAAALRHLGVSEKKIGRTDLDDRQAVLALIILPLKRKHPRRKAMKLLLGAFAKACNRTGLHMEDFFNAFGMCDGPVELVSEEDAEGHTLN